MLGKEPLTLWIETHDLALIDASAVEAIKPVTRTTKVGEDYEVILMTPNHSYVFARGFSSLDDAVKASRSLTAAIAGPAAEGRRLVLDTDKLKIQMRYTN